MKMKPSPPHFHSPHLHGFLLKLLRVLRAVSRNWAMLWQTAMLVVIVLFIFAAVGTAGFEEDFALGTAAEAVKPEGEDFAGCATLGQVCMTRP